MVNGATEHIVPLPRKVSHVAIDIQFPHSIEEWGQDLTLQRCAWCHSQAWYRMQISPLNAYASLPALRFDTWRVSPSQAFRHQKYVIQYDYIYLNPTIYPVLSGGGIPGSKGGVAQWAGWREAGQWRRRWRRLWTGNHFIVEEKWVSPFRLRLLQQFLTEGPQRLLYRLPPQQQQQQQQQPLPRPWISAHTILHVNNFV